MDQHKGSGRFLTTEQLKKLHAYHRAIRGHAQIIASLAAGQRLVVGVDDAAPIVGELSRLVRDFPGLSLPSFDVRPQRGVDGRDFYRIAGFQAHLATILGRLEAELESTNDASPVIEKREFRFVRDDKLRAILERDYSEIQTAYVARCWKSVIVLSGGALEAILLDLVTRNEAPARASSKAPRQADVTRWDLSDLIAMCVDLKLVDPYASMVSDATRAYRNLVHPGNEVRTGLTFAEGEAKLAVTVLEMIHRDLSR